MHNEEGKVDMESEVRPLGVGTVWLGWGRHRWSDPGLQYSRGEGRA
jgi:hypothetical protein